MANYYATTVSEGGELKEGFDKEALQKVIDKYTFGDLNVSIKDNILQVWGESATEAYIYDDKTEEEGDVDLFDEFLIEICPFLEKPLIVSEVGNEKCRYVCAYAYIAKPNGKVESVSLAEAINNTLK